MAKLLSLEEIRTANDLPREEVEIPEWGGAVIVQGVSVEAGMDLLKQMQDDEGEIDPEKATLQAFVRGVVEPKFTAQDVEWLKGKSLGAVTKVTNTFLRLCGFDTVALKNAKKAF